MRNIFSFLYLRTSQYITVARCTFICTIIIYNIGYHTNALLVVRAGARFFHEITNLCLFYISRDDIITKDIHHFSMKED